MRDGGREVENETVSMNEKKTELVRMKERRPEKEGDGESA